MSSDQMLSLAAPFLVVLAWLLNAVAQKRAYLDLLRRRDIKRRQRRKQAAMVAGLLAGT